MIKETQKKRRELKRSKGGHRAASKCSGLWAHVHCRVHAHGVLQECASERLVVHAMAVGGCLAPSVIRLVSWRSRTTCGEHARFAEGRARAYVQSVHVKRAHRMTLRQINKQRGNMYIYGVTDICAFSLVTTLLHNCMSIVKNF